MGSVGRKSPNGVQGQSHGGGPGRSPQKLTTVFENNAYKNRLLRRSAILLVTNALKRFTAFQVGAHAHALYWSRIRSNL